MLEKQGKVKMSYREDKDREEEIEVDFHQFDKERRKNRLKGRAQDKKRKDWEKDPIKRPKIIKGHNSNEDDYVDLDDEEMSLQQIMRLTR
jgi:non-homologous end joining protein Ku